MRVLVIGASGVLGRAAVPALLAAGHDVLGTARGGEKSAALRRLGATPIDIDIYDSSALSAAMRGCDGVVRLTTKIPPLTRMRSATAWEETNRLRTEGARVIVDAALAAGVGTYVHESVTFVYADGGDEWIDERAPVDVARTRLLAAVHEGEQHAARFVSAGGRGVVLRFAGLYGADAPSTTEMARLARRRLLAQFGNGRFYTSWIYVPDAGVAVAAACGVPSGVYNVGDDEPLRYAEYLVTLARASGAAAPLRAPYLLGKLFLGDVWGYVSRSQRISNAKLKSVSSWSPAVPSAHEGFERIAATLHA